MIAQNKTNFTVTDVTCYLIPNTSMVSTKQDNDDNYVNENEEKEGWKVIDWIGRHWMTSMLDKQTSRRQLSGLKTYNHLIEKLRKRQIIQPHSRI